MKFGIIDWGWGPLYDIKATLKEIRESGWDGCEVRLPLDWMGHPDRMKSLMSDTGCDIFCLATLETLSEINPTSIEMMKRRIEYAEAIGVHNVMLFPPPRPINRSPSSAELSEFASAAEALAEYAKELGIALSFHHHIDFMVESIEEAAFVLDQTRNLKVVLDFYQAHCLGDSIEEAYNRLRHRIHYIHIHDGNGLKLLDLGMGIVPVSEHLEYLKRTGYDGYIVTHGGTSDYSAFEKSRICREFLRSHGL